MALIGNTNEEKIWNFLKTKLGNEYGVAGLMGNLYSESGFNPQNLQNTYEKKFGLTDAQYTAKVDDGSYDNFVQDKAGYGLAQWTYWSRKQALLNYARQQKKSIGDLEMQLNFLNKELQGYTAVISGLKNATSVRDASDVVLLQFERPADQSEAVQKKRAGFGQTYYDKYATKNNGGNNNMSNSPLVTYTKISPNSSNPRNHKIDTITIHCVVGQLTAAGICGCFTSPSRQASCNYAVGKDGDIGLCVEEKNRSWCTSSASNDNRAITIEVASDKSEPYAVTDKAYEALIKLVADICKRNDIKELKWKADKSLIGQVDKQNMTVHRWFANKSCPGKYLYDRHGDIANRVNKILGSGGNAITPIPDPTPVQPSNKLPKAPFTVQVIIPDLNYRSSGSMSGAVKGQTGKGVFTIVETNKDGWGKLKSGAGWIYLENPEYCKIGGTITGGQPTPPSKPVAKEFKVKIQASALNYRKGPGTNYAINGTIRDRGIYTIVEVNGDWGKLKSGAGWIHLGYTHKI